MKKMNYKHLTKRMKMRKFLFLAACTLLMASCSSDSFLGEEAVPVTPEKKTPILFSSVTGKVQKAPATGTSAATLLGNKFVVYGANTTDGTAYSSVFDNYQVTYAAGTDSTTESNTSGWEYVGNTSLNGATQGIKYWDQSQQKYQFVAVSGLTGAEKITNQNGFTVTVDADKAGNVYVSDRVTVLPANYNNTVQLSFRRLTSRIRVGFYETIPGYAVKDVKFYYTTAAAGSTTVGLGSKYPSNGTYTVTYGANDVANVAYAAAGTTQRYMQFGTLNYTSAASTAGDPAKPYLDADGVPTATATNAFLGTTSTTATFGKGSYTIDGVPGTASDYRPVLPLEDNNTPMYLNADFTLVATDGSGSTIKVNQAHATVPAALTQWKPNYSYTYLFKITDRVNGSTNPPVTPPTEPVDPDTPIDPTNPVDPSVPTNPQDSALYAITFDAVVVAAADGIQEVITTVTTPCIVTYQAGAVVTTNDEYKKAEAIYISGVTGTTTSSDITLYKVTAGTATEAAAANAFTQGKSDPSSDNYDKTSLKMTQLYGATTVTAVPAADGTNMAVNALKFTPATAGTYIARYYNGTTAAYKVIKVVD